jgi:hypothetical protein
MAAEHVFFISTRLEDGALSVLLRLSAVPGRVE